MTRPRNEIDAEVRRLRSYLAHATQPTHQASLRRRITALQRGALCLPPKVHQAAGGAPEPPAPPYDANRWRREFWSFLLSQPEIKPQWEPTRFDPMGFPLTEDEHGRPIEDLVYDIPPELERQAQEHADFAVPGRPNAPTIDPDRQNILRGDRIEALARARHGVTWNWHPARRAAYQRQRELDWAAADNGYDPFAGCWGRR
jgi:hypothetical protein